MKSINFFTIILLTTLFFTLTTSVQYEKNINTLKKISNSFYSDNAITFHGEIDDKEVLKNSIPKNSILYATIKNDRSVRAVYNNGYRDIPNLMKGRFFEKNDYTSNNKVAVVGKNIAKLNDTVTVNSKKFTVIGIIGYETPSKLDDYTWINLDFDLDNNQILNYVIDSPHYSDNLSFVKNKGWSKVAVLPQLQEDILYLTNTQFSTGYFSLAIIVILLMTTYILVKFIIQFKQTEVYVKKIHGYKNIWIIKDILKEFLFLVIPSFIFSIALLTTFNEQYYIIIHLICTLAIISIISLLISLLIHSEVQTYEKKYKKL